MTVHGFRELNVAQRLKSQTNMERGRTVQAGPSPLAVPVRWDGWILQTPSGGIPARTGSTLGKADCVPYYVNDSDVETKLTDSNGNDMSIEVFNLADSAVAGSVRIMAINIAGKPVCVWEEC